MGEKKKYTEEEKVERIYQGHLGTVERNKNAVKGVGDLKAFGIPQELWGRIIEDCDLPKENFYQTDEKEVKDLDSLREDCLRLVHQRGQGEEEATELIAEEIKKQNKIYTTRDDIKAEFWIYSDGIYKPNGESYIKEFVRKVLSYAYTPQRANKVSAKIETDTMINQDEFFGKVYLNEICVLNGVLDLKTRELSSFTSEKIFFNKMPVVYDDEAECPNVDKFFKGILSKEEDTIVLYELAGFCLHKDYFIEKAFMFVGDGRNGKGKTLSLLKNFLGIENVCSVKLEQMETGSSALCELHNRLVNLSGDLNNTALRNMGLFKELTARDIVQVKRKYLRDLGFVNYAKMIFACNDLPRVYDLSKGFWSRWILLKFPFEFLPKKEIDLRSVEDKKFCKLQDPLIIDKISTPSELSGLLNMALDGLDRLKEKGDFSYSVGTAEVKDFWIRKSDSFMAFCIDKIKTNHEQHISKKIMRKEFNIYCREHRVNGCGDKNIKAVLGEMFGSVDGKRMDEYCWEGIAFKSKLAEKDAKLS